MTGTLKSQVWNRPVGQCMSLVQCQGLLRLPGMGEGAWVECWPRRRADYGETPRKVAGEKTKKQTLRVEGPKEITSCRPLRARSPSTASCARAIEPPLECFFDGALSFLAAPGCTISQLLPFEDVSCKWKAVSLELPPEHWRINQALACMAALKHITLCPAKTPPS